MIERDRRGTERLIFAPHPVDPFAERLRKRRLFPHSEGGL
jgi:hypothetical protein